jgi:hypothetical protein
MAPLPPRPSCVVLLRSVQIGRELFSSRASGGGSRLMFTSLFFSSLLFGYGIRKDPYGRASLANTIKCVCPRRNPPSATRIRHYKCAGPQRNSLPRGLQSPLRVSPLMKQLTGGTLPRESLSAAWGARLRGGLPRRRVSSMTRGSLIREPAWEV